MKIIGDKIVEQIDELLVANMVKAEQTDFQLWHIFVFKSTEVNLHEYEWIARSVVELQGKVHLICHLLQELRPFP